MWSQAGERLGSAIRGDATSPHETPNFCWVVHDVPQPQGSTPSTQHHVSLQRYPFTLAAHLPAAAMGELPGQRAGRADAARLRYLQHCCLPPAV